MDRVGQRTWTEHIAIGSRAILYRVALQKRHVCVYACLPVCVCVSVHFVCPIADVPRLIIAALTLHLLSLVIDWLLRCAPPGRWADIYIVNIC